MLNYEINIKIGTEIKEKEFGRKERPDRLRAIFSHADTEISTPQFLAYELCSIFFIKFIF